MRRVGRRGRLLTIRKSTEGYTLKLKCLAYIRQCRIMMVMIFIETSLFTKLLPNYLSDDEYRGLQAYLLQKPDAGDIVKGSGGVRKVRAKAVVCVPSIIGKRLTTKYGC